MWNIIFHVQIHHTDYAKPRRIVTMTPNKPAVYFVADIFLVDMVVADIDFPCGRYGFFAVADIVLLWPIWFVAGMVAPHTALVHACWD